MEQLKKIIQPMDLVLLLLLLFVDQLMYAMLGANEPDSYMDLDKVQQNGAILLSIAFVIALPTFFFGPDKHTHRISGFWPWAAVWLNAVIVTLMGMTAYMVIMDFQSSDPYTEQVSTLEFVSAIVLFISFLALPIILAVIYTRRVRKQKTFSETVRSLLLIPVIFFGLAYLDYVFDFSRENEGSYFWMLITWIIFFIPFYVAPRWFALGDNPESNTFKNWLIRFALFTSAMWFEI